LANASNLYLKIVHLQGQIISISDRFARHVRHQRGDHVGHSERDGDLDLVAGIGQAQELRQGSRILQRARQDLPISQVFEEECYRLKMFEETGGRLFKSQSNTLTSHHLLYIIQ
jgi:hypothetical protein